MGRTGRPGAPKLDDPTWIALLQRYVAGETAAALALEHGVSESAVRWQARNRGWRKMDRPGAVYRWRQAPPVTPAPEAGEARGFGFDPDDLDGSEARALDKAGAAAAAGRTADFIALTQAARSVRRLKVRAARAPDAGGDPSRGFRVDWDDPRGTCVEILNAMLRAAAEDRYADVRQLERILAQVERAFREMEAGRVGLAVDTPAARLLAPGRNG